MSVSAKMSNVYNCATCLEYFGVGPSVSFAVQPNGIPHHGDVTGTLRRWLNQAKHTPESFAPAHGLDKQGLADIVDGKSPLRWEVEKAVVNHGLDQAQLYDPIYGHHFPQIDDTVEGVKVMKPSTSRKSTRTFHRGEEGSLTPYYDYADTAVSRKSAVLPEWLLMLYDHNGKDTNLPKWGYNGGHFEAQMTWFSDGVNFHHRDENGTSYVHQMNHGDANYIVPFRPHSFTAREKRGYILAVTYHSAIADPEFQRSISQLSESEFLRMAYDRIAKIPLEAEFNGARIARYHDANLVSDSTYTIRYLITAESQPNTKMREITVKQVAKGDQFDMDLEARADLWGYNIGREPLILTWGSGRTVTAEPEESFVVLPGTKYGLRKNHSHDTEGKLLMVSVKKGDADPFTDLALVAKHAGEEGLKRVRAENRRWF